MNLMSLFKKGRKTQFGLLILLLISSVFLFQNCSKQYSTSSEEFASLVGGPGGSSELPSEAISKTSGPSPAALRRLSNLEYLNSVKDATLYQFTKQNSNSGTFASWEDSVWNAFSTIPFDTATIRLGTNENYFKFV